MARSDTTPEAEHDRAVVNTPVGRVDASAVYALLGLGDLAVHRVRDLRRRRRERLQATYARLVDRGADVVDKVREVGDEELSRRFGSTVALGFETLEAARRTAGDISRMARTQARIALLGAGAAGGDADDLVAPAAVPHAVHAADAVVPEAVTPQEPAPADAPEPKPAVRAIPPSGSATRRPSRRGAARRAGADTAE